MASLTKNSTKIDGRTYYYWQKNKRNKNTVVLLHGFPGNHKSLIEFSGFFSNCRVIIPDLPACGESDELPGKATLKKYAVWLKDFFSKLDVDQPIIIGHSFGSRLALSFCEANPKKTKALVLITPVTKVEGLIAQFAAWEYQLAGLLPNGLQKLWLANGLYKSITTLILYKSSKGEQRKRLVAMASQEISRVSPQVSIDLFNDFYNSKILQSAKKVKTKTLVIAGDLDEIAPLKAVKELAGSIPGAELEVIPKSGHMVPLERPQATAKIIHKWLDKNNI